MALATDPRVGLNLDRRPLAAQTSTWDHLAVEPCRIRLMGVEYLFGDERTPPPAGARRLRPGELEALLVEAHPVVRGVLLARASRKLERARDVPGAGSGRGAWADASAGLVIYELASAPPHLSAISIPEPVERPELSSDPAHMFDDEEHWIEIQIVGEDDEALAGIQCELVLPNGRRVRRTSDRFGLVRVEGMTHAGTCEFTLPGLDRDAWCSA